MKVWERYANINFEFVKDRLKSDIRIDFQKGGSYSYIGTDNKRIAKSAHTMNLGWLKDDTKEDACARVVLHETGHAIGLTHEHQHPLGKIAWNEPAVYEHYAKQGWDKEQVKTQVLKGVSASLYSAYDPTSIMQYPLSAKLVKDKKYICVRTLARPGMHRTDAYCTQYVRN